MSAALICVPVAFAAFCVWLAVRIVNRRERWAKRMAWTIAIFATVYPLSSGPVAWVYVHLVPESCCPTYRRAASVVYFPFQGLMQTSRFAVSVVHGYQCLWVADDEMIQRYMKDRDL